MKQTYKPEGYNSVSPYFIVPGAQKLIDLLTTIFDATVERRYDNPDGQIMHAEVRIIDTVIMLGDASDHFPANRLLVHVYVPDVDETFRRALAAGCTAKQEPKVSPHDPDRRGSFEDFAGNTWSIGTQQ